jgi:hypothetical protein
MRQVFTSKTAAYTFVMSYELQMGMRIEVSLSLGGNYIVTTSAI